jgi:hypothetical protein
MRLLLISAALVLLAGCGWEMRKPKPKAEALEKVTEKGPVTLTVRLSPKEPRLSDLVDLDVIITAEPGVELKPVPFGKAVGDFLVPEGHYTGDPEVLENGKLVKRLHYQLEPVRRGKHLIRSIEVEFVDKREGAELKDKLMRIESDPLEVSVTSELGDDAPSLAALTPMTEPLPLASGRLWRWVVLGLLVWLIAAVVAIVLVLRRRRAGTAAAVQRTPEEIAQAELDALLAEQLPAQGRFGEFYVRLTGVVRRYIERRTGIHAPEQTTEEFLRETRTRDVLPRERAQRLVSFLEAADMVKYAALLPGQREVEESVSRAKEFVGMASALAPLPAPVGR